MLPNAIRKEEKTGQKNKEKKGKKRRRNMTTAYWANMG